MPALTVATDKTALEASGAAAATQPRAASPAAGPPMSPITPPLHATRLPGDDSGGGGDTTRPALTHTTQQTPTTLPLAPGPEPIDFEANPDTIALRSAISVLQLQRRRAAADIQALSRAKEEAVGDPEAFVRDLVAGKVNKPPGSRNSNDDGNDHAPARQWTTLPKPQDVVRCPPVNWSQYAVVGDSLDKLHAEQVARPTQGTPAAYIPGHAGMYEFRGGDGRQETYQGAAVPYNPVKDRVDRKATSKARK